MRGSLSLIFLTATLLPAGTALSGEPVISIRFDSSADTRPAKVPPPLFSLPPEEWCNRYASESIVYVPGEKARFSVEISPGDAAPEGEIALVSLVFGGVRPLYHGPLSPGTYGSYEAAIMADFEVYQVRVRARDKTIARGFYGIRPWRGMKDFSTEVSLHGIFLGYQKPARVVSATTTPWDVAIEEGTVPLHLLDANWALASHVGKAGSAHKEWWLWTHYASATLGLQDGRTGLFWGEYDPSIWPVPVKARIPQRVSLTSPRHTVSWIPSFFASVETDGMLPCEIYFRERIQPMLRNWAENLSEKHPNQPLTISLGDGWSIGHDIGHHFGPETLRHFVSWMKEQFGISIEADTFKELIRNCEQYPRHFHYFVARNTTMRSLELTCDPVRDIVARSKVWDINGVPGRRLIALPEAAEFCRILSRYIAVGTIDDQRAWGLTHGNPLPYSLSNMVVKAFAPDHDFCVGWKGCDRQATDGEIYRWYLEPAWITAYDAEGKICHLYTHSPPTRPECVWRSLIQWAGAPDEKVRVHDKCFQLMEAIGVEKPIGPVFVCKDWTFADDKLGTAFRSDLYEKFLISLRRRKVPISSAVHADHESALPAELPRIYAPRMSGPDEIRFGFRAGFTEKWFACEASAVPDSLVADFASELNSASGDPVVFPPGTSIEGYAFEAKGMIFIVAEEMAGRKQTGEVKVKASEGDWTVIDIITAEEVSSRREGEYVVFESSLEPNSATLYSLVRRKPK